jgi:hypothetical protein
LVRGVGTVCRRQEEAFETRAVVSIEKGGGDAAEVVISDLQHGLRRPHGCVSGTGLRLPDGNVRTDCGLQRFVCDAVGGLAGGGERFSCGVWFSGLMLGHGNRQQRLGLSRVVPDRLCDREC